MEKRFLLLAALAALPLLALACSDRHPGPTPGLPPHHAEGGGFRNVYLDEPRTRLDLLRWLTGLGPDEAQAVHPDDLPVWRPVYARPGNLAKPDPSAIQITWVGHSTFLIQTAGLSILTDPHWGERASPVSFAGPARLSEPGVPFESLPRIDVVLLSHNHYDHLDAGTVERLSARYGPDLLWLVPLGLAQWFADAGVPNVRELDWWESAEHAGLTFTAVPAQHFSSRTLFDRNETLWCGWAVAAPAGKVIFAGDAGYSPHFREIGERLGPFRAAMLPIGAYMPRWFMRPMHLNPPEALDAAKDLMADTGLAMHWGTFKLTEEPVGEPPVFLGRAMAERGLPPERFRVLDFGQTVIFGKESQ